MGPPTRSRGPSAQLGDALGQTIVVENGPGAGASLGADRSRSRRPTATRSGSPPRTHAINPHLYGKLTYDPVKDFTPITHGVPRNLLLVNPALPVQSVGELIAYAKANPGKLTSAPPATAPRITFPASSSSPTGAPMQHIPYKGSAPGPRRVSGQLTLMFDILVTSVPQIRPAGCADSR